MTRRRAAAVLVLSLSLVVGLWVLMMAVAAGVTFLVTPLYRTFAFRIGAVDVPEDRKVHRDPTPTAGGLAIFAGVAAGFVAARFLGVFDAMFTTSREPFGVIAAALFLVLVGVVDDVRGMKAPAKLAAQAVAAGAIVLAGIQFVFFWLPGVGLVSLSIDLAALLTVVWTVAVINGLNLIDGLDGLAAGVTAIAAGALFVYAYQSSSGQATVATLFPVLVFGSCVGFLPHNFNPARVFMGDAGSMLLGFVIAGVAVSGVMKSAAAIAFVAPLIILAIPILDTSFVILKRLKYGLPVYSADRSHFHHRFFTIGWGQRKTVLALYAWCALMGAAAITLRFVRYRDPDGSLNLEGALVLGGAGLLALAASVYMVYILEILKWRSTPVVTLVRQSRFSRAGRREVARR